MSSQCHQQIDRPDPTLEVPGGVYLCQVGENVSCGACCGLYNVADLSRDALTAMLNRRTEQFRETPRTVEAIDAFARQIRATEPHERPFPQFHHCPFIGMIGDGQQRVGCLLHPLGEGNDGVDFRGLSYYGALACRTYFCPSTHRLPARYKRLLRTCITDWYAYGLIVTEQALVRALLQTVETRLGRPLHPDLFEGNPQGARHLVELLELKIDWPFRPAGADTPCHHFFLDAGYEKPAIDYTSLGLRTSPFDEILVELVSALSSPEDAAAAETRVEQAIQCVVKAL